MRRLLLFIFIGMTNISVANAGGALGAGTTSVTDGRPVPGLYAQFDWEDFRVSGFSSGMKTPVYYQSAWQLNIMKFWHAGELWWGTVDGGVGGGIFYTKRGYKDSTTNTSPSESEDFVIGPSIRAEWNFGGPVFVTVEALFGLRNPVAHVLLSFQDIASGAIGVRF